MATAALAVTVFLHVLGAALWVGGTLTLVVVNRLLKRLLPEGEHARILGRIGRGATPVLAAGLLLAILTGLELFRVRYAGFTVLLDGGFWSTTFGTVFAWKGLAILLTVAAAGLHGILAARGLLRGRAAASLGIATAVLGLLILLLGATLRWL